MSDADVERIEGQIERAGRELQRGPGASNVDLTSAGKLQRGAMVHRGAGKRNAQRHIDRIAESVPF